MMSDTLDDTCLIEMTEELESVLSDSPFIYDETLSDHQELQL